MSGSLQSDAKKNVQRKSDIRPDFQKDLICQEVLDQLGVVNDFHQITAKNVFDDKWRINVWTTYWPEFMCAPSYKIKHSYFCTIKENCVSGCVPEILPVYK